MTWKPQPPPFRVYKKQVYLHHAKTAQFIYQLGEGSMIRSKSKPVSLRLLTAHNTKAKIAYLKKCHQMYRKITGVGRGIAGIQVGIPERIASIYMPDAKVKYMIIINPKITNHSKEMMRFPEGCMSEGPIFAPVNRPVWIEFTYYDEQGNKQVWVIKDADLFGRECNRVFQHEIDHMNGVIFLDRADLAKITLESDPSFYSTAAFETV